MTKIKSWTDTEDDNCQSMYEVRKEISKYDEELLSFVCNM